MHMRFLSRGFKNLQWYGMTDKAPETPVFRELCHARKQVLALFLALLGQPAETVRIKRSMRSALSRFIWSVTWPYASSVKAAVA